MLFWIIVGGLVLRWIAPGVLTFLGVLFLAFLILSSCAGIKEKEYGWKEALSTLVHILCVLWLMNG